jgi:predicted O-methyltransferase YrrM
MLEHFWKSIPGHFSFTDLYAHAARSFANTTGHLVEVGTYHGQSAAYFCVELANATKRGVRSFHVVDRFSEGQDPTAIAAMLEERTGVPVVPHKGQSDVIAKDFLDASCDFVFIDADHSYEAVLRDIDAWWPKVRPGGMLAGHDVHHTMPGVQQAVMARFEKVELWRGIEWCGRHANEASQGYFPSWAVTKP